MRNDGTTALRVTSETDGPVTVLRLAGELDLATAGDLREHLRHTLTQGPGLRRLVVDLAGLEFLDVTGLNALLEAKPQLASMGASLSLRRPRPMVRRMLALLDLEHELVVEP